MDTFEEIVERLRADGFEEPGPSDRSAVLTLVGFFLVWAIVVWMVLL